MKKLLIITLIMLLGGLQSVAAGNQKNSEAEIKAQVSKALSKDREVTVNLKSGKVIKGKILSADTDTFRIEGTKSTTVDTLPYSEVASVKVHGNGGFGKVFGMVVGGPAYATGGWKGVIVVAALFAGVIAIVASSRD
jgi:hypothetical protein